MVRLAFYSEKTKPTNKAGFTLVEIMVVIMIIALLMAIAVPVFIMARRNSQTTVCVSHLRQIQGAKERWAVENKKDNNAVPTLDDLYPPYVKTRPVCPAGGIYSINSVAEPVTCSYGGDHRID